MIRAEKISLAIGEFRLQEADLAVSAGEYFVLLGPPGSGKSVFLECLCGLKRVAGGRVFIDGRDVTHLEPRQRCIGYVPQDYALFPHLSVEANIGFGLRSRGLGRDGRRRAVRAATDLLGITHLLPRGIAGLSGGERQRVALARALVLRPKVLLLDEPVSTLDEATRQAVCAELRRLPAKFSVTVIHVSHHIEEAFTVADRAGVIHQGRFQQVSKLGDLLRAPANEFVARFMCCENIFTGRPVEGRAAAGSTEVQVNGIQLILPGRYQKEVRFIIRPENVLLIGGGDAAQAGANRRPVRVDRVEDRGMYVRVELQGALPLTAHLSRAACQQLRVTAGADLLAVIDPQVIHVLPE